jgi:hypothetical protein
LGLTGRRLLVPLRANVEALPSPARLARELGRFATFPDAAGFALERLVARAALVVRPGLGGLCPLTADFVLLAAFLATAFFALVFFAADLPAAAFVDIDFFAAVFFAAFVFTLAFFEPDFFATAFLRGLVVLIDGSS